MLIIILVGLSFFSAGTDGRNLRLKTVSIEDKLKARDEPSRDPYDQAKSRMKNHVADAQNGTSENQRKAITARAAGQTREERNETCQKLKEDWGAILDSMSCCEDFEKGIAKWYGHSTKPETLDLGFPHCLPNGQYAPYQCVERGERLSFLDFLICSTSTSCSCFCVKENGDIQRNQEDFGPHCNPYPEDED